MKGVDDYKQPLNTDVKNVRVRTADDVMGEGNSMVESKRHDEYGGRENDNNTNEVRLSDPVSDW